jgi:hypothetical protein
MGGLSHFCIAPRGEFSRLMAHSEFAGASLAKMIYGPVENRMHDDFPAPA